MDTGDILLIIIFFIIFVVSLTIIIFFYKLRRTRHIHNWRIRRRAWVVENTRNNINMPIPIIKYHIYSNGNILIISTKDICPSCMPYIIINPDGRYNMYQKMNHD